MRFIAEIGLNHNGSDGLLIELIRQAAISGSTFAKFQLGWRDKTNEMNHFDIEKLKLVHKACEFYKIKPLFSVFHKEAWALLKSVSNPKIVKIASRTYELEKDLIKNISYEVEEMIVSTGMTEKNSIKFESYKNAKYLWCKSEYPLYGFNIKNFPKNFQNDSFSGLSDHTLGLSLSLLAISRGANIIERHFTLDKSDQTIRDHALSSTPDEFATLVKEGNALYDLVRFL